jgi:ADP-heptose:LPS heptosyltransferase
MRTVTINKNIDNKPTVCVLRFGAWGDAIIASPVFRFLKQDGYYVIFHCNTRCYSIAKNNPNIDSYEIVDEKTSTLTYDEQIKYQKRIQKNYSKFINLTGSIENSLLIAPGLYDPLTGHDWFEVPKEKRHIRCNVNYFDYAMKWCGYPDKKGEIGEIYLTEREEAWAKKFWAKYPGYKVVWAVTGSSMHKAYPYANYCVNAVLDGLEEAHVVLVGELLAKGLIQHHQHPRLIDKCADFGIRKSLALVKYADLVVTPETAVNAAAGCFEKPMVTILSHSTEENLTKYYKNCIAVYQPVSCYPCHKIHYTMDTCPTTEIFDGLHVPRCQGLLHPKIVVDAIEKQYLIWRKSNGCTNTTNNHKHSNGSA